MDVLALGYRPVRFVEVVGQDHVKTILRAIIATEKVPPALVFSGTRGTGKTTCARIFAAALNCENPDQGDACGSCPHCVSVQQQHSNSVTEVDAASNGGVEQVRQIKDMLLHGHEAKWRVVILDEAHSMSKEAYNALLKVLEEPPANTVFVLVTTEPDKILGTVRSRTMPFEFRRIRNADVVSRLSSIAQAEGIEADDSLFSEISRYAQGGLRDAVMVFDQVSRVGISDAEGFRDFFGIRDYSLPLMWSALRGDHAEGYRLVAENFSRTGEAAGMVADLSRLVSDLLVIKSEGRPKEYSEEALAERVEMAQAVPTDALVKVIEILWDLRSRTRSTENDQRSSMEMGFALISHLLKPVGAALEPQQQPILARSESGERLSLAEIQRFSTGR